MLGSVVRDRKMLLNEPAQNSLGFKDFDGGRTIPYDFHHFCSNVWGAMQHQRGTWFEMFREQMLNTATNWQNNLKDALWETVRNFNINSV
jgi:hypothetical protein